MHSRHRDDVGNAKIIETPLALLEEENELIAGAVVIAHADGALVPHQGLPELEARTLGLRLCDEHGFGIAEQVEMPVRLQSPVGFVEELAESRVRKDSKPVVARGLAVLQPCRGADCAML